MLTAAFEMYLVLRFIIVDFNRVFFVMKVLLAVEYVIVILLAIEYIIIVGFFRVGAISIDSILREVYSFSL